MMRRAAALILCAVFLLSAGGCKQEKMVAPVRFYYPKQTLTYGLEQDFMLCEVRESNGHQEDLAYLLGAYLAGPATPECRSPFPLQTKLLSVSQNDGMVILILNEPFAALTGMEWNLACVCLSITCMELTGAEAIQIRAQTASEKKSVTITREQLLLIDDGFQNTEQATQGA